jgi:hypothetical protein
LLQVGKVKESIFVGEITQGKRLSSRGLVNPAWTVQELAQTYEVLMFYIFA